MEAGEKLHGSTSPKQSTPDARSEVQADQGRSRSLMSSIRVNFCIGILFVNYFLAQYDKFILSYFQDDVQSTLSLSPTQYGLITGYATGIVYALLAIPIAYLADYTRARVWLLTISALWWSLCVIFQSLANNFWQILLARIGMGVGQASVEALSISLISDLVEWRNVFVGESVFFVGVYIGEAVSGQIATAFTKTGTSWQIALRAMGIVGLVVAVILRLALREPPRQASIVKSLTEIRVRNHQVALGKGYSSESPATALAIDHETPDGPHSASDRSTRLKSAKLNLQATMAYLIRMRSFWLLVLSAGFRQLAGVVFGFYMPSYLANTYPSQENLLSRYGIIVGVVGSVAVLR